MASPNLVTIPTALAQTRAMQAAAGQAVDDWSCLSDAQREKARHRMALIQRVLRDERMHGVTRRQAIRRLLSDLDLRHADAHLLNAASELSRNEGRAPDEAQLYRWLKRLEERGIVGLADAHKGRQRKTQGWEERAIALWLRPTKMAYATVAITLEREGFAEVKEHQVRAFLQSLPNDLGGEHAPQRVGRHAYNLKHGKYKHRDTADLPVGFVYQGDGHTCDVYVRHPNSGSHYRPELTIWLDVRTGLVVGRWISESESLITSLYSLTNALTNHDHVPAAVHTDPGPGFKNEGMLNELSGFLPMLSIDLILALPGNAKGKGLIAGWFRRFEEREGKRWPTFMQRRTDDALLRMESQIAKGKLYLPTQEEYMAGIDDYCRFHNERHVPEFGMSRLGYWEKHLERVPVILPMQDLLRPRVERVVQNWTVRLWNRFYRANDLRHWNDQTVIVQYDLHDERSVDIRDVKGRFICAAPLVRKAPWLGQTRLDDLTSARLDGQIQRKQKQVDEMKARARPVLTHEAQAEALDFITPNLGLPAMETINTKIEDFDPFDALSDVI